MTSSRFLWCATRDPVRDNRIVPVADLARSSVEAIRRERPEGPYILGGHCYGGVVAYEAALQLMSQGQRVDCLVLFDAATPGYPKVHRQWRRYVAKAREIGAGAAARKIAATALPCAFTFPRWAAYFARRRKASASRVLTAIGSDVLVAGQEEKTLNGMAMWEYTPREFPAPIIHFIAADQPVSTEVLSDPRLGWSDLARAGLAVRQRKRRSQYNFGGGEHTPTGVTSANECCRSIALPNMTAGAGA